MSLGTTALVLNIAAWIFAIGYVLGWSHLRRPSSK